MPGGRPQKANNRGRIINVRVTQQEFTALEKAALASGESVSEYMRRPLSDIEIDAEPDKGFDATTFAGCIDQFFKQPSPCSPPPLKGALEAAGACQFASFDHDNIRFQLWATGRTEVVTVYGDGGMELWVLPDECGGLPALLHVLRHLTGTSAAEFVDPPPEFSPPAPIMEELQAATARRFAECPGPLNSRLQFWATAEQHEVMLVYKHDGEVEAWRLFR
jgi:hypothetical protein